MLEARPSPRSVSEIAFGAHQVHNPRLMQAALDGGINTFCTSGSYLDGREEESIGQVIRAIGHLAAEAEERLGVALPHDSARLL